MWRGDPPGARHFVAIRGVFLKAARRRLGKVGLSAWLPGLRREQARRRAELPVLRVQDGRLKVHPIIDRSEADAHRYLRRYDLPDQPLRHQGYVPIGDDDTTTRLLPGMLEEETRFFGPERECGLHR